MRLLTANLYSGRADVSSLGEVLDLARPDIVMCQEVGSDSAEMLRSRFSHGFVVGDDHDHSGRAMVSDLPINVTHLQMPHRPGLRTRVEIGGTAVELIGIHLANPVVGVGAMVDRRHQTRIVIEHLDEVGTPAIVVGDLNATPAWPAYRRLRTRLRDGVADAAQRSGERPRRTWAPRPGWPAMLRIDHVLTAGVVIDEVGVRRVSGSDHLAVAVNVSPVSP